MIIFQVLRCDGPNTISDLLAFTLRMVPDESMADSGEPNAACESPAESRRKRKRKSADALDTSLAELDSFIDETKAKQAITARTELLKQMRLIMTTLRELGPEDEEGRALLQEELDNVKAQIRQIRSE